MLRSLKELLGYKIDAEDGAIGKIHDFLFDDERRRVRHVVADIGGLLTGKYVLLPPEAFAQPMCEKQVLAIGRTRRQIEAADSLYSDPPVSKRHEVLLVDAVAWAPGIAPGAFTYHILRPAEVGEQEVIASETDPHLRSFREVLGYAVEAADGSIGKLDDVILDTEVWTLVNLVVETGGWLRSRKILLATGRLRDVDWPGRRLRIDLEHAQLANCPEYDPATPVNVEQEERVYDYHGRFTHRVGG